MATKCLSSVFAIMSNTACYHVGSNRVTPKVRKDYTVIANGLTLWTGILLDHVLQLNLTIEESNSAKGRIYNMSLPPAEGDNNVDLSALLSFLDKLDAILLYHISASRPFKVGEFINEVSVEAALLKCGVSQVLTWLVRHTLTDMSSGRLGWEYGVKLMHQSFVFLKKITIDRPDVVEEMYHQFIDFEAELTNFIVPALDNPEALKLITEMNALARAHLVDFDVEVLSPGHGPGAVADPTVKCAYDKYVKMAVDRRIEYVLAHASLGTMRDYNPAVTSCLSSRTSRYICVPKSWKKLRGISAEPSELQFFQQGVNNALDAYFLTNKWWKNRINLHDQSRSRELARLGSIHDGYATIDLSSASDSVTLELVRRVFKGTPVLKWLLATRSTSTLCDGQTIKIAKFAPMGSSCCFPVECMIFALAAQVSSDRTRISQVNVNQTVCVYGDDIIVDWYAADACITNLNLLGFSVNTEKSYTSGDFRESCGAECYRGYDITPFRYKLVECNPYPGPATWSDITTLTAYCNSLYARNCHTTREYLVSILLNKYIQMGTRHCRMQKYLSVTYTGERGSLASPCPTNFNRVIKYDRNLQCLVARKMGFRRRPISPLNDSAMVELQSTFLYVEWLLDHQPKGFNWEKRWVNGWLDSESIQNPYDRLPIGLTMVPTEKWDVWDHTATCR